MRRNQVFNDSTKNTRNKKWNMAVKKKWCRYFGCIPCSKFGVNRPKQTKVIERKKNSIFSNSDHDLDHIHLGSNPKLRLDISYPYSKFDVNMRKQTKVIEQKLNFYFK